MMNHWLYRRDRKLRNQKWVWDCLLSDRWFSFDDIVDLTVLHNAPISVPELRAALNQLLDDGKVDWDIGLGVKMYRRSM